MFQQVVLFGNLGKDPEVKYTPSNMAVARFSLATSKRSKDKDGNWSDRTEWHNCVAFARTAEIAGEYLKKGSQILVVGELQTSSWEDKETGAKKYRTEVVVNELKFAGKSSGSGNSSDDRGSGQQRSSGNRSSSGGRNQGAAQRTAPKQQQQQSTEITDEDIPF